MVTVRRRLCTRRTILHTGFVCGAESYPATSGMFYWRLFNSNNFAGSAVWAEACALLSVILVVDVQHFINIAFATRCDCIVQCDA